MKFINIIHDSRRVERYNLFIDELNSQLIFEYFILEAIIDGNVIQSINKSHKKIVQMAKTNNFAECCIFEDDILFTSKNSWNYFLENKPQQFKIYSACNYLNREHPTTKSLVGLHCYIIHESYYNEFLALPDNEHIDQAIKDVDIHVCYPFPCLQRAGFSSNNMSFADYNKLLKPEDIYK